MQMSLLLVVVLVLSAVCGSSAAGIFQDIAVTTNYTDSHGQVWFPLTACSSGSVVYAEPSTSLIVSSDPTLYSSLLTFNTGSTCSFAVANGTYSVTGLFVDGFDVVGGRMFNISVNGAAWLTAFDITATAGGKGLITNQVLNNVVVTNGQINIVLSMITAAQGAPLISGIQIIPQTQTNFFPTYPAVATSSTAGVSAAAAKSSSAATSAPLAATSAATPFVTSSVNINPLAGVSSSVTSAAATSAAAVRGDPFFVGLRGQRYQVHGIDGAVYNLISDANIQLNARFTFLDEDATRQCPIMPSTGKQAAACFSHPGSYLSELGLQVKDTKEQIRIVSGSAAEGFGDVTINGKAWLSESQSRTLVNISSHELTLSVAPFMITIENVDGFVNLRSVEVPWQQMKKLTSHGLLGQTWNGKVYAGQKLSMIQGNVDDYIVGEDDVFGVAFPYNQFSS